MKADVHDWVETTMTTYASVNGLELYSDKIKRQELISTKVRLPVGFQRTLDNISYARILYSDLGVGALQVTDIPRETTLTFDDQALKTTLSEERKTPHNATDQSFPTFRRILTNRKVLLK